MDVFQPNRKESKLVNNASIQLDARHFDPCSRGDLLGTWAARPCPLATPKGLDHSTKHGDRKAHNKRHRKGKPGLGEKLPFLIQQIWRSRHVYFFSFFWSLWCSCDDCWKFKSAEWGFLLLFFVEIWDRYIIFVDMAGGYLFETMLCGIDMFDKLSWDRIWWPYLLQVVVHKQQTPQTLSYTGFCAWENMG